MRSARKSRGKRNDGRRYEWSERLVGRLPRDPSVRVVLDPWILGLAGISLLGQLAYILFAHPPTEIGDQVGYRVLGADFGAYWSDGYYGSVLRTPGYPAFLALYDAPGSSEVAVQASQAIALSVCCLTVAALASWQAGVTAGRVSALLFAIYLPLLSFSSMFLTEALSITLGTIGVAAAVLAASGRAVAPWTALAVAVLGVSILIRPTTLTLVTPTLLGLLVALQSRGPRLRALAVATVVLAVLFSPWIAHNYQHFSKPLPLGDPGPVGLALGVHLPIDEEASEFGSWNRSYRFWSDQREDGFGPADAVALDARSELRNNLSRRPWEFVRTRIQLQYQMWIWPVTARTQYGQPEVIPYRAIQGLHIALLVAAIGGLVITWRTALSRLFLVLTVSTAAPFVVYYPEPRYLLPVMPFLIASSGVFAARSAAAIRRAPGEHPATTGS
jgi:hypothetical protein